MMMMNMAGSLGNDGKVMKFGNDNYCIGNENCCIGNENYCISDENCCIGDMMDNAKVMSGVADDVVWRVCCSLIVRFANGWKMVGKWFENGLQLGSKVFAVQHAAARVKKGVEFWVLLKVKM